MESATDVVRDGLRARIVHMRVDGDEWWQITLGNAPRGPLYVLPERLLWTRMRGSMLEALSCADSLLAAALGRSPMEVA